MVIVPISAGISAYENDAATKGLAPYIPDVENLIHDVWVVQYSSRGVLLPRSTFHYRTTVNGVLEWNGMTYEEYEFFERAVEIPASEWGAEYAYQIYLGDEPQNEYMLCYTDSIIILRPDFQLEITQNAKANIGKIFGGMVVCN